MTNRTHDDSDACDAPVACRHPTHFRRRTLLRAAGCGGVAWLTPLAEVLAGQPGKRRTPAKSVIVLWLDGGPSQLETFDPHPGSAIGGETRTIRTAAPGILIGSALPRTAEVMDSIALVRSVTSLEGDHERATYNAKTGFRPDPTLVHPSIGAVACHQLTDRVEIPRHISILPGAWAARGGFLGDEFDAFKIGDPADPIPDVKARVSAKRAQRRIDDLLNVVERQFAKRRLRKLETEKTLHRVATQGALRMMASDQLQAFDVTLATQAERKAYGETPFGRGCLAARRLIEVGVRCVEVTLSGWDTHINNHELQMGRIGILDPAFATLIQDLRQRSLLQHTVVVCGGEFGRTPKINAAGGRDHWPHGFTMALAGGGIRGGAVYGATSPTPVLDEKRRGQDVKEPRNVADVQASVLAALGIDFAQELETPVGRPMALSQGKPIRELLSV